MFNFPLYIVVNFLWKIVDILLMRNKFNVVEFYKIESFICGFLFIDLVKKGRKISKKGQNFMQIN